MGALKDSGIQGIETSSTGPLVAHDPDSLR
jgi:hypothetical protein